MAETLPRKAGRAGGAGKALPAWARLLAALAVLGLFVRAYLSGDPGSKSLFAPLVKSQFSAALYGTGIASLIVIAILAFSLIFGRLFCSVLCPLGTAQELVWRIGNFFRRGAKNGGFQNGRDRLNYKTPPRLRRLVLLATGAGLAAGFFPLMLAADPISNFGRGMGAVRALMEGGALFTIAIGLPLLAILAAAFFRGRAFCAWCPVGQTLGLFSRAAPFGIKITSGGANGCISCGICEKKCPVGCIDSKEKRVDGDRCVLCFSCQAACPRLSAAYGFRPGSRTAASDAEARRVFLRGAGRASLFCSAVYLFGPNIAFALRRVKGSSPEQAGPVKADSADYAGAGGTFPLLPPGAKDIQHYRAHCTGCQACVASCPVGIIKAGASPQPTLDYSKECCQYNCTDCGNICPSGAISRLSIEKKHRTRLAMSALNFDNCVVNTKRNACGACAEVCPTKAILMQPFTESGISSLTRPVFDERYCIGCGACLVACPAVPRAFTIRGVEHQVLADLRPEQETGEVLVIPKTEEFPF